MLNRKVLHVLSLIGLLDIVFEFKGRVVWFIGYDILAVSHVFIGDRAL